MSTGVPAGPCPGPAELARAASLGPDPQLRLHLERCPTCAADLAGQAEVAALGPLLPFDAPDSQRLHRVRAGVLAAVGPVAGAAVARAAAAPKEGPRTLLGEAEGSGALAEVLSSDRRPKQARSPATILRRVRPAALMGLVAAAAGVFLVARWALTPASMAERQPERGPAATQVVRRPALLVPGPGARFAREAPPPHEVVRLWHGRLRVSVEPARAGETFRVVTARGEVEVRGTVFEVEADGEGLRGVTVERGRVAVRPDGQDERLLAAGQRWASASEPEPSAAGPFSAPLAKGERPGSVAPSGGGVEAAGAVGSRTAAGDPVERAFDAGLRALKARQLVTAAGAFQRAAALAPAGPLAEDARYWRAVALARAGRDRPARLALEEFLARHPASVRSGEASVVLGWLLLEGGDPAAERRLRAGLEDPSPRVRQRARAGLTRLAARAPVSR